MMRRSLGGWRAFVASLLHRGTDGVAVWDLGVRTFHWLLVASVLVAGLTGFFATRSALDVHLIAGSAIAALLGYRVVWGLLGPGYARFASFAFPPRAVLDYARAVFDGRARRYLGHNPLGGAMVFALLAVLALIVVTGVVALGGVLKQGPMSSFTSFAAGDLMLGLHNFLSGLLVAMVIAHLAGVLFESRREGENLVMAMVTGHKQPQPGAMPAPWPAKLWLATGICVAGGAAATVGVTVLAARPGLGVPPATLDPVYARECGACHFAFPPSLATAATWRAIMAHLDDHFGEDANLSPAVAARLRDYLAANSAEHWDTLPAERLSRRIDPAEPLRITASVFWRRMHDDIPAAVFANRRVGGRTQCNACHTDAAIGRFAPQSVEVPESLQ